MIKKETQFNIPILLLTWKRDKEVELLIAKLKKINAKNIYINSDGCELNYKNLKQIDKISQTRSKIIKNIDWDCKLRLKFNNKNLGCKNSVIEAINWFFENEESGIILEEDCIPDISFFYYGAELLEKYKDDKRIGCITGVNFQDNQKVSNSSYYFSKYNHCWGWATWKKEWEIFDSNMNFWPDMKSQNKWIIDKSMIDEERNYWENIFENSYLNLIDSWAYPWLASLWYKNKLTITPEYNLVSNKGFDGLATHTKNRFSSASNRKTFNLKKIIHNSSIKLNIKADRYTFKNHFLENYSSNIGMKLINKIKLLIKIFLNPKKGFLFIRDIIINLK